MKKFLLLALVLIIVGCAPQDDKSVEQETQNAKQFSQNKIKIGVTGDIHYCSAPGDLDNRELLKRLADQINKGDEDFFFDVGDKISFRVRECSDNAVSDLNEVFKILETSKKDYHHVLGDHDIEDLETFNQWLKLASKEKSYYSFNHEEFHIIGLDTVTGGKLKRDNGKDIKFTKDWSQGQIFEKQLNWLKRDLEQTEKEKIIIFSGQPLFYIETEDKKGTHDYGVEKGKSEIIEILKNSGKKIAAISGDAHVWHEEKDENINHFLVNTFGYSKGEWAVFIWDDKGPRMEKRKTE